jgi:cytochrome c553
MCDGAGRSNANVFFGIIARRLSAATQFFFVPHEIRLPDMKISSCRGILCAVLVVCAVAPAAAQSPGSADAGRHKSSMCAGCHNIPGYKTAFPSVYSVPKIDGQHAAYIVSALRAYKSGERQHPSMRAVAASLSDQDMADLAAFYSAGATKSASR